MKRNSLEEMLVKYTSPTLMGIKAGSLFNYNYLNFAELEAQVKYLNSIFKIKDVKIVIIKNVDNKLEGKKYALIYVYLENYLKNILNNHDVRDFLVDYGYYSSNLKYSISRLIKRVQEINFPHEIGIFLGYPLDDVKGFIINKGKNYCFSGKWKVYCHKERAEYIFKQFDKCREELWMEFEFCNSIEKLISKIDNSNL